MEEENGQVSLKKWIWNKCSALRDLFYLQAECQCQQEGNGNN